MILDINDTTKDLYTMTHHHTKQMTKAYDDVDDKMVFWKGVQIKKNHLLRLQAYR